MIGRLFFSPQLGKQRRKKIPVSFELPRKNIQIT